jgi:hypothetical protein
MFITLAQVRGEVPSLAMSALIHVGFKGVAVRIIRCCSLGVVLSEEDDLVTLLAALFWDHDPDPGSLGLHQKAALGLSMATHQIPSRLYMSAMSVGHSATLRAPHNTVLTNFAARDGVHV